MTADELSAQITAVTRERDLYLRLLHLGREDDVAQLLREALGLMVELGGARQGYIELHDNDTTSATPQWWIAHGFSAEEIEGVRSAISGGIVAEALATAQTIVTPSALCDPRFSTHDSVRLGKIEAVLCAPIGEDPPRGVVYLQGPPTAELFSEGGRLRGEMFARHLAPFVDR